jgi:hypothetical protein
MDSHAFVVNDGEDDATAQIYGGNNELLSI